MVSTRYRVARAAALGEWGHPCHHDRRGFFELADIATSARRGSGKVPLSPIALEAESRIDGLFAIEREINGVSAAQRHRIRQQQSRPVVEDLRNWLKEKRAAL